ncbi:hypothetical protein RQP46_006682 [Phenoliferia psychrophenolica]
MDLKRPAEPTGALSESTNIKPLPPVQPEPLLDSTSNDAEPEVETTAEDILYDLEMCLQPSLQVKRPAFTGATVLASAPPPGLVVEGLGRVESGSSRDADAIKSQTRASLPHVTVEPDVSTAATRWNLEASAVAFQNTAAWTAFVQETVRTTACTLLSTNPTTTDISFEGLVLHGPSSSPSTFDAFKRQPSVYGFAAVALPSSWEGGIVTISLGPEKVQIDQSKHTQFLPSLVTWHADTSNSISPITSGHRLTIIYSLSHTSSLTPIPTVLNTTTQELSLAATFSDWRRALDDDKVDLDKAVIVLSAKSYAEAMFHSLQGADKALVELVQRAAIHDGFDVYLAEISLTREEEDVSDDEDEPDDCDCPREIMNPHSATSTIEIISLEGVGVDDLHSMAYFALELNDIIGDPYDGKAETEEYEQDTAVLTQTFTRFAVVLFPCDRTDAIIIEHLTAESLSTQLNACIERYQAAPANEVDERARARVLADGLQASEDRTAENSKIWLPSFLGAVIALRDEELFNDISRVSSRSLTLSALDTSTITKLVEIFGNEKVLPLAQAILRSPQAATTAPALLAPYYLAIKTLLISSPSFKPFSSKLYAASLSTTSNVDPREAPSLAALVADLGAAVFERDILPLLSAQQGKGFKTALVKAFLAQARTVTGTGSGSGSDDNAAACRGLATQSLSAAVAQYRVVASQLALRTSHDPVGEAWDLIALALDFDRLDLIKVVLDAVLAPASEPYITQTLQPFLVLLKSNLASRPERLYSLADEPFRAFADSILGLRVRSFQITSASIGHAQQLYYHHSPPNPTPLSSPVWALFTLILDSPNPLPHLDKLFHRLLLPPSPLPPTYFSISLVALWQEIEPEFKRRRVDHLVDSVAFKAFNNGVLRGAFDEQVKSWTTTLQGAQYLTVALDALKFAVLAQSLTALTIVTDRVSSAPLATVQIPFCTKAASALPTFLLLMGKPSTVTGLAQDSWAEPLRGLLASTFNKGLKTLGQRPALADKTGILSLGCGCTNCISLDAFLVDSTQRVWTLSAPLKLRDHIAFRIQRKGLPLNLTSETIKARTPHQLRLTKPTNWAWNSVASWKVRLDPMERFGKSLAEAKLLGVLGLADAARNQLQVVER